MDDSAAVAFAVRSLKKHCVEITAKPECASHVLLGVPSKPPEREIPSQLTIIGGNLDGFADTYSKMDLLRDPQYLAENAALTAHCTLRLLGENLGVTLQNCPVLVIGWGRIGKCLSALLKAVGADLTVAARKASDWGMLTALGYRSIAVSQIDIDNYRAIVNTAPAPVLEKVSPGALNIDLASRPGLTGENVLWARGLPGKMVPESSGALIAKGILRQLQEEAL